jgi:hypothetical protein
MGLFSKLFGKKDNRKILTMTSEETEEEISIIERPRICCLDLNEDTLSALRNTGANIFNGTLGSKIKIPNTTRSEKHQLLLNYYFPPNLHEYDVIIIDLDNSKTIDYQPEEHIKETYSGKCSVYFLSTYPETLFDPRPYASYILRGETKKINNRKYLILAFSSEAHNVDYEFIYITEGITEREKVQTYNIYSFWKFVPIAESKYGKEIYVSKIGGEFQSILEKYKTDSFYNQTFKHPITWEDDEEVKDEKYLPLMTNMNGDIISYIERNENDNLIILPQLKDKSNFLIEFLSKIAPSFYPELFPYLTTFSWKEQKEYWLPGYSKLLEEKSNIVKEFEKRIEESKKKIEDNLSKYSFLHELITATGDCLTKSLIQYLKWLGFEKVKDYDQTNSESAILEEDIQVELADGLLIIECKGIGGTSTDSDCNQISKIKHRRCKERNKFDVFALYVVNHQRYLPPKKRQNPPFTEHQIQDAKNEERGLLTTWQLFSLFFDIENEVITKEEARKSFLEFGFVDFRPKNLMYVFEPTEIFKDGEVCIVNIENILLQKNEELLIEKNGKFERVNILDIQENGKSINQSSGGELGLKLSSKIKRKSIIWKKQPANLLN